MKKYFSLILVLVLAFAMAVSAFAAGNIVDEKEGTGKSEQKIDAVFVPGTTTNPEIVYHVTVSWGAPEGNLTYSEGNTVISWDAENTVYKSETTGDGWTGKANVTVTVENRSNAAVTATAAWTHAASITDCTCTFDQVGNTVAVGSAAEGVDVKGGERGTAKTATITATIEVSEGTITKDNRNVGTITLTIAGK